MKNQYFIIFVTSVFLTACTTTPKSNNYSYTKSGRWIASSEEKASAKASAIMFLTDQAISSCKAIDEILQKAEQQQNKGEEVQVSAEELKQAMLEVDDEGNVSLRNPNCKDRIFALAQVVCDSTVDNDSDQFCAAVKLRKQVDRAMLELRIADIATVQKTITQLSTKIEDQKRLSDLQKNDETAREVGKGAGASALAIGTGTGLYAGTIMAAHFIGSPSIAAAVSGSGAVSSAAAAAAVYGGGAVSSVVASSLGGVIVVSLASLLLIEAGVLVYSLVKALDKCKNSNIERCRRRYFARTHNNVWAGIIQVPVTIVTSVISFFSLRTGSFFIKAKDD